MRCWVYLIPSGTVTGSTVLCLPDLVWLLRFLQSDRNFLNHLVTVLWSNVPSFCAQQIFCMLLQRYITVRTRKAQVTKLDNCKSRISMWCDYKSPYLLWLLCSRLPHKLPTVCFLKSLSAFTVFERSTKGGWHNSAGSSSDGQVKWVARLSSNSKNIENPLFNKQQKIVFIETRFWDNE